MDPVTAMMVVPLLIWAGVFAFMLSVDRRVRALENRVREQQSQSEASKETILR